MGGIAAVREQFAARVTLVMVGVTGVLLVAGVETYVSAGSSPDGAAVASVVAKLVVYALVSLLVVGVGVGYNTVVALRAVTDRAERLADGELDLTFESGREDEFGSLAASLARMRDTSRNWRQRVRRRPTPRPSASGPSRHAQRRRHAWPPCGPTSTSVKKPRTTTSRSGRSPTAT
jgi:methyl-accepting chemotaxis protein